jgi:1,2-diacylglycerol 3-alpha-glucosyltransferase
MIATSYYPTIGGLENYMHGLATRLAEKGYKITIQTIKVPDAKGYECLGNIKINRTKIPDIPGTRQIFWFFIVLKTIYSHRKDIAIIHAYPLFMTGVFVTVICKLINKPIVIREGMSSALLDKVLNVPLMPFLAGYVTKNSKTYVNNPESINLFKNFGIPTDTLKLIRTPIDTKVFEPIEDKEYEKTEMGIESNFTLLYVGRFIGWKNVDSLIKAMPKIVSLIPNANLILVGDGPDKDKLIQLTEELEISNHITFTGFIPQDEVHHYFQIADIFVTLATHAKKGKTYQHPDTTIYQAMACGIPIISPPDMQGLSNKECPGVSTLKVIDTGLIVNNNKPENFIDAIEYLYKNPEISRSLGTQGRRIATKELTWDKHINRIEQIYSKKFGGG